MPGARGVGPDDKRATGEGFKRCAAGVNCHGAGGQVDRRDIGCERRRNQSPAFQNKRFSGLEQLKNFRLLELEFSAFHRSGIAVVAQGTYCFAKRKPDGADWTRADFAVEGDGGPALLRSGGADFGRLCVSVAGQQHPVAALQFQVSAGNVQLVVGRRGKRLFGQIQGRIEEPDFISRGGGASLQLEESPRNIPDACRRGAVLRVRERQTGGSPASFWSRREYDCRSCGSARKPPFIAVGIELRPHHLLRAEKVLRRLRKKFFRVEADCRFVRVQNQREPVCAA